MVYSMCHAPLDHHHNSLQKAQVDGGALARMVCYLAETVAQEIGNVLRDSNWETLLARVSHLDDADCPGKRVTHDDVLFLAVDVCLNLSASYGRREPRDDLSDCAPMVRSPSAR